MSDYWEDPYLGGEGECAYHVMGNAEFAATFPDHPWSKEWLAKQLPAEDLTPSDQSGKVPGNE